MTKNKLKICLETSSYLPLIWTTPYSQGVIKLVQYYREDAEFYIQEDCIVEALSYIHLKIITWKDEDKFEKGVARIRDVYHYKSTINSGISFDKMIVANTGFSNFI